MPYHWEQSQLLFFFCSATLPPSLFARKRTTHTNNDHLLEHNECINLRKWLRWKIVCVSVVFVSVYFELTFFLCHCNKFMWKITRSFSEILGKHCTTTRAYAINSAFHSSFVFLFLLLCSKLTLIKSFRRKYRHGKLTRQRLRRDREKEVNCDWKPLKFCWIFYSLRLVQVNMQPFNVTQPNSTRKLYLHQCLL